jgi:ribosome-associated protein
VILIPETEVVMTAIRAQGSGGQHVNKVSSAIHLRFDIGASSLPEDIKARLLKLTDQRVTKDGVVVIKAQKHRSQELNKMGALFRLHQLVQLAVEPPKPRLKTKPSYGAKLARLDSKSRISQKKTQRGRVSVE